MTAETEQLEVQIAEALGLWKPGQACDYDICEDSLGNPICPHCGIWDGLDWSGGGTDHDVPCPASSSDIAASFQVVEAMRERGWEFGMAWPVVDDRNRDVLVEFSRPDIAITGDGDPIFRDYLHIEEHADTPALAIVRASLAALKAGEGAHGG